ncbi:hypothetical protein [Promicromonospora sp. NPDC023805]|uniref:hypothetical protein n=1 Tax=Promicromonospora sp. NPDC023805 TaxID=3154696 RepID=UPI0033DC11CD
MNHRYMRRRQAAAGVLTALFLTLLTACGVTDVHIDELGNEAEAIGESLLATIDDVPIEEQLGPNSGWTWTNVEMGGEDPGSQRYWGWNTGFIFAEDTKVTPEEAADRMATVLKDSDDGWTVAEHSGNEGGGHWQFERPAEAGSHGQWVVAIYFSRDDDTSGQQTVDINIVGPSTGNRAESEKVKQRDAARDAVREFETAAAAMERALDRYDKEIADARAMAFFGSAERKTAFLEGVSRWRAASSEIRDFIQAARAALDLPAPTSPAAARALFGGDR